MMRDQGVYEFGPFRMIPALLLLMRGGRAIEIGEKEFMLLYLFVKSPLKYLDGKALTREVFDIPKGTPDDEIDSSRISHLTRALKDRLGLRDDGQEYIQTLRMRGYRLSVAVEELPLPGDDPAGRACKKGFHFLAKYSKKGFHVAIESFEEALAHDPRRVEAHLGRSEAYTWLAIFNYNEIPSAEALGRAHESARRALELAPSSAAAHTLCAFSSMCYGRDWGRAWRELHDAVGLDAKFATARLGLALWHVANGDGAQAAAEIELARRCDELSPLIEVIRGFVYFFTGRRREALGIFEKMIEEATAYVVPASDAAYFGVAQVKAGEGSYEEALAAAETAYGFFGNILDEIAIIYIHGLAKRKRPARARLKGLLDDPRKQYASPYNLAAVSVALGDRDGAFARLREAVEGRDPWGICLRADPRFARLRADPRFGELLSDLGLPPPETPPGD